MDKKIRTNNDLKNIHIKLKIQSIFRKRLTNVVQYTYCIISTPFFRGGGGRG
jgi:hypothetical protein